MHPPPSPPHIEELPDVEEEASLESPGSSPHNKSLDNEQDILNLCTSSVESSCCSSSSELSSSDSLTAYEVLGVEPKATRHVIKKAFKRKVGWTMLEFECV